MQIRRMAHRTPIFTYAMLGCVAGGPTLFLVANIFWLLAAFRPERSPELTQMFNDLAWITFTSQVPFLIAQSVLLALAIYFDDPHRPVLPRWVAYFNLVVAAALVPAALAAPDVQIYGLLSAGVVTVNVEAGTELEATIHGLNSDVLPSASVAVMPNCIVSSSL